VCLCLFAGTGTDKMEKEHNSFHPVDYAVVAATLIISVAIGVFNAYFSRTNEELLVGGRNLRVWPVAASIMVTYVSAITVLGKNMGKSCLFKL